MLTMFSLLNYVKFVRNRMDGLCFYCLWRLDWYFCVYGAVLSATRRLWGFLSGLYGLFVNILRIGVRSDGVSQARRHFSS